MPDKTSLDEADKRILRVLQNQPELTMRELGEATGLSHTPCWRRLKRLQEEGYITDKRYLLDAQKMGFEIVAFCFVRMASHKRSTLEEFERASRDIPEVVECYTTAGEYDFILKVLSRSVRDYEEAVKHKLLQLPHVSLINTSLTLKEVKNTPDIPV